MFLIKFTLELLITFNSSNVEKKYSIYKYFHRTLLQQKGTAVC